MDDLERCKRNHPSNWAKEHATFERLMRQIEDDDAE
jgi:hypothetical protein